MVPSASDEADESNDTASGPLPEVGVPEAAAAGGRLAEPPW